MISVSLAQGGDGRLIPACDPRRPGETLYDYLVRSRHKMGVQVRMLEAHSDAQAELFASEQARWRRRAILLAIGEAGFAAASYAALDHYELAATMPAPLVAAAIGSSALAGAAIATGVAATRARVPSWALAAEDIARRLLGGPRRVIAPSAILPPRPAARKCWLKGIVPTLVSDTETLAQRCDRHPGIDDEIEERAFDLLEMRTFFWGLGLLVFEAAIVTLALCTLRAWLGVPLNIVIADVPLVSGVCLIGGLFLLLFSDFVSTGLARLARWWRRR